MTYTAIYSLFSLALMAIIIWLAYRSHSKSKKEAEELRRAIKREVGDRKSDGAGNE